MLANVVHYLYMVSQETTAADFATFEAKAARLNLFGLHSAAEDCWEAAQAAAELGNDVREGFYRDELATYRTAARKRMAGDVQPTRTVTVFNPATNKFEKSARVVRILAVDMHRTLCEDVTTGRWTVESSSNLS